MRWEVRLRFSTAPNWGSNSRLALTAAGVTLIAACALAIARPDITTSLGDTDDAMRLVIVRHLLRGGGWFDQWIGRLQPPVGVYMHWSRLLDGVLAGLTFLLERVMPAASAETLVRFFWPLMLIAPAVGGGLAIARRVGGETAVFIGAILLLANMELYSQFRPGRIDHHNVQIVMAVVSAACALARKHQVRFAIASGVAASLGLAIGLEALPFLAIIGGNYGVMLVVDPRQSRPAGAYGLALVVSTILFFMIQTPPWRWSMSFCDALAFNLVAAVAVGGLGLAALAVWASGRPLSIRAGLVVLVGLAAIATYLALEPACVRGPFAAVDPRLRPFWFDSIEELAPWSKLMAVAPLDGLRSILIGTVVTLSAVWLGLRAFLRRDWTMAAPVALALCAVCASAAAYRAEDYCLWFGMPVLAAALADLCRVAFRNAMIPTVCVALAASPVCIAMIAGLAVAKAAPLAAASPPVDHCHDNAAYGPLAGLPQGIVLSEIDLGPFILADTPHSAISAPYHRMSWGILAAHAALWAPPAAAEPLVRGLGAAYVVSCPADKDGLPPGSLAAQLARGRPPNWLSPLSPPSATLAIYKVKAARPQ